ncbi:hypothetical protein NliqN6_0541 [Naganishia liquefaciens]|uniref:Uncharacterized protein n=1 Tax=Naganishia liquefaciens TaxID=104408 RepID=A0A8H3TPV6_9TREE|nr:hypothetical protein NliqN6_0541 [Naganishia liquefaciens]
MTIGEPRSKDSVPSNQGGWVSTIRLDLVAGSSRMAPMASKEGESGIPRTGGSVAQGVLGLAAERLHVELPSSGLDFWRLIVLVGNLDAALWRLCNPGLPPRLVDEWILLGIGSWLKRLVVFGEIANSPAGTGGRDALDRRAETPVTGETMLRPNVNRLFSSSLASEDSPV